ncbi:hypothetical protein MHK_007132, partial [Candidatus Magnetomorum sp. HK-1]
ILNSLGRRGLQNLDIAFMFISQYFSKGIRTDIHATGHPRSWGNV